MKKTVQIVTVPINKIGWNKEDIIINTNKEKPIVSFTSASFGKFVADKLITDTWQAQQLLVLSDDVQHGDISYHSGTRTHTYDKYSCTENCKKVIGSYPNIQGTLPLSKETIQQWIDNGTPEECSVEMVEYEPETYGLEIDYQGNLILEFAEKTVKGPTIPTDVEIEEKAKLAASDGGPFSTHVQNYIYMYQNGYKQALKDLGYDNK